MVNISSQWIFSTLNSLFSLQGCIEVCSSFIWKKWNLVKMTACCHLPSFAVTRCHSLSLVTTRCLSLYHSLPFIVTRCNSLSLVIPLVFTRCITCLSFYKRPCSLINILIRQCFFASNPKFIYFFYHSINLILNLSASWNFYGKLPRMHHNITGKLKFWVFVTDGFEVLLILA